MTLALALYCACSPPWIQSLPNVDVKTGAGARKTADLLRSLPGFEESCLEICIIYPSIHPSINASINQSSHSSIHPPSIHFFMNSFIQLSFNNLAIVRHYLVYPHINSSIHLCIHPSIHSSTIHFPLIHSLSIYQSIHVSTIHQFILAFIHPSSIIHLSILIFLFIHPPIHLSIHLSTHSLSINLSIHPFIHHLSFFNASIIYFSTLLSIPNIYSSMHACKHASTH